MPRVMMEDMSWQEIAEAIDAGYDSVIIPVGSIEQHGPQLPISADSIMGDYISEKVALSIGKTLVAPTIQLGPAEYNMEFPGTLTISEKLLKQIIYSYVDSLFRHKFKKVILLPTHDLNFKPVKESMTYLKRKYAGKMKIIAYTEFNKLIELLHKGPKDDGIPESEIGAHAGLSETSYNMVMRPDLVKTERIAKGYVGDALKAELRAQHHGMRSVSNIGVIGDPTKAKASYGEKSLEALSKDIVEYIRASG